jgi:hypothetical protein
MIVYALISKALYYSLRFSNFLIMKKSIKFFAILAISAWGVSCSSSSSDATPASKTDLLTGKTWIIDEVSGPNPLTGSGTIVIYKKGGTGNLIDFSKASLSFSKPDKYTGVDQDGVAESGTWKFVNGETAIESTDSKGVKSTATISKLTSSNLDVTQDGATLKMIPR